jgi:cytochrome b
MAVTGYYMTQRGATLFGIKRDQLEGVHKLMANLFLIAVPIHIIGVIFESVRHRENLVMAMITGRKRAGD